MTDKERGATSNERVSRAVPGDEILPTRWRKRPVVIDAIRWSGTNLKEVIDFTSLHSSADKWTWQEYEAVVREKGLKIFSLEGSNFIVTLGDYIIKGVKGEFYACKPDIFLLTYERADTARSETAEKPVDPESEAANPVWDLVIQTCAQAWPAGLLTWSQSPTELIVKLIDERDEAKQQVRDWIAANAPGGWIDNMRKHVEETRSARSATAESSRDLDSIPLRCVAVGGVLDMRIGEKVLAFATDICPALWDWEKDRQLYRVKDAAVFAREVADELNQEGEDGSTPLTRLLDECIAEAVNQGAEGVEEIK